MAALIDACPPHSADCYAPGQLPCPRCGIPVTQTRLRCTPDQAAAAECTACSLKCADCDSEVIVSGHRARVVHAAECPWWQRYQRREVVGRIPCGTVVTHRGPYKRDPEAGEAL